MIAFSEELQERLLAFMRRQAPLTILLASFWVVSLGVYAVWEQRNWYPITGDEPHHIIIGRSILHYGSLEQTRAYQAEFARGFLGRPGDAITRSNAHAVQTPRGWFSFHSPGTGIVTVLPMAAAEILGYHDVVFIKVFFVLFSGLAVVAAWILSSLYIRSTLARVSAVLLTCFSLPLVIAASQVFPDLPAGVIGVFVLAWLTKEKMPLWQGVVMMCLVSWLPWLHYKFAIMAAVLGIAVLYAVWREGSTQKRLLVLCLVPAVAAAAFFYYNNYAFGSPIHLDSRIGIHGGHRALMSFLGLNLDRWHGFLLQNPAFFMGVFFLVPFVRAHPRVGLTALLAYLAVTGINAAHGSAGYSFAGRHAWTGCMLFIPATIYGLGCLERLSRHVFYAAAGLLLLLQGLAIAPLLVTRHDLYNPNFIVWFDVYPSFFPVVARFLPAFYDADWWYRHATNHAFTLFAALLIGIGAWSYPRRSERTLRLAGGLLLVAVAVFLLTGAVQPDPPRKPLVFSARSLNRHFGIVLADGVLASVNSHGAGIWSFGPYIRLATGDYRVRFSLQSDARADMKVGSWDVTGRAGQVRLGSGDIMGTAGDRRDVEGTFDIPSAEEGEAIETRLFFEGTADLLFVEVVLEPFEP